MPPKNIPPERRPHDRAAEKGDSISLENTKASGGTRTEIDFRKVLSDASVQTQFWNPDTGLNILPANYTETKTADGASSRFDMTRETTLLGADDVNSEGGNTH